MIPINHFSWSDSLPCHSASAHCHYTAIGLIALKRETQKYCLWLLKKRLVNSYFQIRFSFSFGRWLLTISSLLWWLLWRPPSHHRHGGGSRASCSQRHTETCSQVEPRARTAPCRPLLCIFKKAFFDIWTTGCISLYCLTDADVGPLRLCFCSVSGTLEFSRLLLSSGPLDSWILDAAQYQQLYKMIISLIFMEQFFSCHSLSLE